MFAYAPTLISQYANSPVITALIADWAENLDADALVDEFYTRVWNIETAEGWGLDVWGRIVGVSRLLLVANDLVFGFEEASTASAQPFNQGVFYDGGPTQGNYSLTDAAYRRLILAKAAANICDGSIPAINRVLLLIFPDRGDCYVTDGLDMTMTYTFDFPLTAVEQAIVLQSGVLPRPAGVSVSMVVP